MKNEHKMKKTEKENKKKNMTNARAGPETKRRQDFPEEDVQHRGLACDPKILLEAGLQAVHTLARHVGHTRADSCCECVRVSTNARFISYRLARLSQVR